MARIFLILAVLALLVLVANFVVGLQIGDFNSVARRKRETQNRLIQLERQNSAAQRRGNAEYEHTKQEATEADAAFATPRSRMSLHMLLGSAAAMLTVLVSSIAITYFIGTNRWVKEVCETYRLEGELVERSTRLKRSAFPWAVAAIAAVILVVGLGAAADPSGANWPRSNSYVMPHYVAAMVALLIVMVAFWMLISRIAENYGVIEEIMAEVQRVRAASDLPVEEPISQ